MKTTALREIRLTAFKSFRNSTLPVDPVTVLTGRNSSGKSNALDGIEVLSRLASGDELTDALDGRRREGGPIRGGSRGCAPWNQPVSAPSCLSRNSSSFSAGVIQFSVWRGRPFNRAAMAS
ncbi:MAG: AAA family ATPase, partial [Pseudonocardiales bacterium]